MTKKKKNKIFFCIPNFNFGGAEHVIINLFKTFNDQNNFLVVLNNEGPLADKLSKNDRIFSMNCKKARYSFFSIAKLFNSEKPDIVISTMAYFNFIIMISILISNHRPKKILLRESNTPLSTISNGWYFKYLYNILYNKSDTILCNSKDVFKELVSLGVIKNKVKIMPNYLDIDEIKKKAKLKVMLPSNFNPKLPLFVVVGRLVKQKGIDRLINWFSKVKVLSNLLILGDGPYKSELEKQVHKLGVYNRVTLLGFVSNPYPLILKSNAMLISSRWEGFPNVALESLALGTPVIATRQCGGLIDIVKKVHKDWLCIAKDKYDFISLIEIHAKKNKKSTIIRSKLPKEFNKENVEDSFRKLMLK